MRLGQRRDRLRGNDVADIAGNYLGASTDNRTWTSGKPWFASSNVVTLWPNVTTAPLNDPQVRLAISAGIDRPQLSAQGRPATNRRPRPSGLLLPEQSSLLDPAIGNGLSPAGAASKASQILTRDGYTMTGGK